MKNILLLLSFALMSIFAFGQTPQAFKYQAVARDLNGNPVINQEISVKISILSGSPEGTVEYCELHQTTTNSLGLINLEVGRGTAVTGNFALIAWGNNACFIKTEMDLAGGDNFVFMGTSQLLSVPFSLFSDNGVPDGQNPGDMLYWNGTQWIEVSAGLNGQVLTFNDGVPVWGGIQLPILNTNPVNNITAFTAYCGGNIASDGGSPVTARGLCWNSAPNPTTANFKTTNGSGAGSFNANLNALSASTLYYVRAYATNSAGTSYGNEVTFTTLGGSITLTTTAITAITVNSATSGGNITNNGGASVTMRGVCWNTSPFPTTANSKTTNGPGNGVFVSELTGLAPNTLYYVRAYATNSLGTSYGNQQSFTTQSGIITLTTAEVTEITATTAISGGEITNDGGSPVTTRGVCFSTSQNPTLADSATNDGSGNGVFVSNLTGLLPDTIYYVRSYATNGVGTFYGNDVSFTTISGIITISTTEVTDITASTAISGGEITSDGGSPVTARGVCFSTSQNPTIADSTTNDGSGNGIFVSSLTGILPDTTYYVRSYATNGVGTFYGNEVSFETLTPINNIYSLSFSSGNYVRIPISESLSNFQQITVECWYYHIDFSYYLGGDEHIVGTEHGGGPPTTMTLFMVNWGDFESRITDGIAEDFFYEDGVTIQSQQWYHLAMTYDGSTFRVFINGNLEYSDSGTLTQIAADGKDWVINRHTWYSGSSSRLTGYLDELRISNTCRYTENFTLQQTEFVPDEHTKGLWHFNEGTGNQVLDVSGNNNHGNMIGCGWNNQVPF